MAIDCMTLSCTRGLVSNFATSTVRQCVKEFKYETDDVS